MGDNGASGVVGGFVIITFLLILVGGALFLLCWIGSKADKRRGLKTPEPPDKPPTLPHDSKR